MKIASNNITFISDKTSKSSMSNYVDMAKNCIEHIDMEQNNYVLQPSDQLKIKGQGSVFCKELNKCRVNINFGKTKHGRVFIGRNLKGSVSIDFHGDNSLVYIGNDCQLNGVVIRSIYTGRNLVFIGNNVTSTGKCTFISGDGRGGGGKVKPALIIGDDCMFAWDITLRNTDAHPIFSLRDDTQYNQPKRGVVVVEPHVWIGQSVSILKDVKVGACSTIALGSIVTTDIPRFSIAKGIPAKFKINSDAYWARSTSRNSILKAKSYSQKFQNILQED